MDKLSQNELKPAFIESLRDLLRTAERVRMNSSELRESYCSRTLQQLQRQPRIHFTTPCCDLSLLLAAQHLSSDFDQIFAVLSFIERPLQPVKFQCNLEFVAGEKTFVVGFSETAVHRFFGRVVESRYRSLILRRSLAELSADTRFLTLFHDDGRQGLHELHSGYSLDVDLKWHAHRNSFWRYWWIRMRAARKSGKTVLPISVHFGT